MKTLRPLSFLWDQTSELKNRFYEKQWLQSLRLPVPVISIGNLTMGGTGKTPVVMDLAREFSKTRKVAVICKSYRASLESPARVDADKNLAASLFGDEATVLARNLPEVSVYAGPVKWMTARYALENEKKIDLVIVDDGFQHRRLQRNYDLVVLDATENLANYRCFPEGRAREDWKNLARASAVLLTRTNLVKPKDLGDLRKKLPKGLKIFSTSQVVRTIEEWNEAGRSIRELSLEEARKIDFHVVCGLGRPQQFLSGVQSALEKDVKATFYSDHHKYTDEDMNELKANSSRFILTTEKDAVKLRALHFSDSFRLFVIRMKYEWDPGLETLVGDITVHL